MTRANVGRQLAVVFQERLLCAPVIASEIALGQVIIAGNSSEAEAAELVWQLNRPRFSRFESGEGEIVLEWDPNRPMAGQPSLLDVDCPLPFYAAFRTAEGAAGLLQIAGSTNNASDLKIRCKLVQGPEQ